MTLGNTFFNLFANTFDKILYAHPTNKIGLNSFRLDDLTFLGTKAMKDALQPLGIKPIY